MDPDLVDACGEDPNFICERIFNATGNADLASTIDWVVERPLRILLILIVAWIVSRIMRRLIDRSVNRLVTTRDEELEKKESDEELAVIPARAVQMLHDRSERAKQRALTLGAVFRSIASVMIWLIAGLLILGELDIDLAPLIAGAGIAGVALGFGAQSLVKDFLAGTFIVLEDQLGVGDVVDLGEATGVVERVTLRTTWLRDVEGTVWVVPNGEIRRVGNKSQLWARTVLDIDVAYDTDIDLAKQVMKDAADAVWREQPEDATILEEPEIWGVEAFGPDAVSIRLVVKTEPSEQFAAARLIRQRIKLAFDENGIEIPFPQRTVWLRSEEPAQQELRDEDRHPTD